MFKVPDLFHWTVVITSLKHLEEINKAPDNALSSIEATIEVSSNLLQHL
jgi:hypothetical protein